jgi:hypothetical protein
MLKIQPETRRSMLRAWSIAFAVFAPVAAWAFWRIHQFADLFLTVAVIPALFALFPLMNDLAAARRVRYAEARKTWRATYKASPASHPFNLGGE